MWLPVYKHLGQIVKKWDIDSISTSGDDCGIEPDEPSIDTDKI